MTALNVLIYPDDHLKVVCEPVAEVNDDIRKIVDDMFDTMYDADGVGLAAPQVGILKRIAVIDISPEQDSPIILINPVITHTEGEQRGSEGCLSVPGKAGIVTRPNIVRAKAYDLDMNEFEIEGEELLARALIHEIEHLDGQLYVDKVEGQLVDVDEEMED